MLYIDRVTDSEDNENDENDTEEKAEKNRCGGRGCTPRGSSRHCLSSVPDRIRRHDLPHHVRISDTGFACAFLHEAEYDNRRRERWNSVIKKKREICSFNLIYIYIAPTLSSPY